MKYVYSFVMNGKETGYFDVRGAIRIRVRDTDDNTITEYTIVELEYEMLNTDLEIRGIYVQDTVYTYPTNWSSMQRKYKIKVGDCFGDYERTLKLRLLTGRDITVGLNNYVLKYDVKSDSIVDFRKYKGVAANALRGVSSDITILLGDTVMYSDFISFLYNSTISITIDITDTKDQEIYNQLVASFYNNSLVKLIDNDKKRLEECCYNTVLYNLCRVDSGVSLFKNYYSSREVMSFEAEDYTIAIEKYGLQERLDKVFIRFKYNILGAAMRQLDSSDCLVKLITTLTDIKRSVPDLQDVWLEVVNFLYNIDAKETKDILILRGFCNLSVLRQDINELQKVGENIMEMYKL